MYHDVIGDFQLSLYKLLANEDEIRQSIDQIYLSIMQDAKYPFLLINMLNVDNMANLKQNISRIEFEICIFANDKNRNISLELADKIINKIAVYSFELQNYILAGIKAGNMKFKDSNDLISTKLIINYQALLKQKIMRYTR
ncbi:MULTISPECIES: hypothetical protein [unclassified Rickettsia]|uniref:hypothetical protein n=1 Tax=unclassified Rickettsia TaxID=114295 RepID=UPI0020A1A2D4|nr:hypothetical protein [Rickettsia endosymbiont of Ceutorhynchus assimilis]